MIQTRSIRVVSFLLLTSCVAVAVGCQMEPPLPPSGVANAFGSPISDAIVFKTEGEPLDLTDSPSGMLRIDEATLAALRCDPRVQGALAAVRVAQAEAHQKRLFPNPVVTVTMRFVEAGGTPAFEAGVGADLLAILQRPGRIAAADARLRAATAEALTAVLETWAEVREQYILVQAADAQMTVLEEARDSFGRFADLADARLRAGEATRLDVTSLRSQGILFRLQLTQARLERTQSRLKLARLVGRPGDAAEWELTPLGIPGIIDGDEKECVKRAIERRPELESQEWELQALGADARLARWWLVEGLEPGMAAQRDPVWEAGPSLTTPVPLFDWGQARRADADARTIQAKHELVRRGRLVIQETRDAAAVMRAARTSYQQLNEELFPLLQRRRGDADAAYRSGTADVLAPLFAERELQDARVRLIEVQRQALLAEVRLARSVGGPLFVKGAASQPVTH